MRLIVALTCSFFGSGARPSRRYWRAFTVQMNAPRNRTASSFGWPLKLLVAFGLLLGLVVFAWIIGRVTGHLHVFSIPSSGNGPTIAPGDYLIASDLIG